ncbi:uncharacterized protein LOC142597949 [Dermatophagoides farinae]|uniref:uncharacterized protein LOC142597949 n=1 Tax=Dermatophagoides farinae TaxID=6954 RepID=UPI003F6437B2
MDGINTNLSQYEMPEDVLHSFASRLPNPCPGNLVLRFAPEPSGYLHLGHIKAIMLNEFFINYYGGKLLLRFDDTNPTLESFEFQSTIEEDLALLKVNFCGPTFSSDYLPELQVTIKELILKNLAYVDDTDAETIKKERLAKIESKCRNNPVEKNLKLLEEIFQGTEIGQTCCVRGKIDMQSANGCMRDPVFWRCNLYPHHRHGTKYKSWPTYDFCCPLIDSWSGVTHALRANEYADRIPMYQWVQDVLNVRKVEIFEFSRLNLTNTVLSKRKLAKLVQNEFVSGWDDPRFPTVRGLIRRGIHPDSLRKFMIEIGPSKNTNLMEWDKLLSINSKTIDNLAKRYSIVQSPYVVMNISNIPEEKRSLVRSLHPKNPDFGQIHYTLSDTVLVDMNDALNFVEGLEITLLNAGSSADKDTTKLSKKAQKRAEWKAKKALENGIN